LVVLEKADVGLGRRLVQGRHEHRQHHRAGKRGCRALENANPVSGSAWL
jgi:hypothetical protein